MRLLTLALAAMVLAGAAGASAQTPERALREAFEAPDDGRIFAVAHRACWRAASENSLGAIRACARMGVDLVEIDVQLSRDGVPVLSHDSELTRMTGKPGKISDLTVAQLKQRRLRAGAGGPDAPFTKERIPTLAEALATARGKLIAHLDLKRGRRDWAAVWKVVEAEKAQDIVLMKITEQPGDPAWGAAPFLGETLVRSRVQSAASPDLAGTLCALEGRGLAAHTVMFTDLAYLSDLAATRARCGQGRLWAATESRDYAGGLDDALALKDPEAVWGRLIQAGFTVLESDHPEALTAYLRGRRTLADRLKALRDPKSPHVLVIAHRGCWQDTAENSLAGLRLCDQVGVDMVEADVRRSKDGVLVMMHDATVDRTTSGAGRVDALTLAELRTLRLRRGGGGPDAPLIGETVSTFAEYMAAAKGRMLINLDPKAEVNAQAYEELKASGLLGQVLFKQAAAGEQDLAASAPFVLKAPFAMPITAGADPLDVVVQRLGNGPFAAVELSFTEPSRLAAATAATRKLGARAWLNTLRDPKLNGGYMDSAALTDPEGVWGYLLEAGVDAFQTDEPRALIRYLRTKSRW